MEEAIANFQRANKLDPRDQQSYIVQAFVYRWLRDRENAERVLDRLLEFAPDHQGARVWKAGMLLQLDGDLPAYEVALESAVAAGVIARPQLRAWDVAIYKRDYETALKHLGAWEADAVEKAWFYGLTYDLAQMPELALPQFELARTDREQTVEENPEDPWRLASLGEVLAYLGERDRALELTGRASELLASSTDATDAHVLRLDVFWAQLAAEDYDSGLQQLHEYLANPGIWSIEGLLLEPRLDPIRDDPQFQALVEKYRQRN
jgi:tetratricopeptide (TPR) repeat protein